MTSIPGGQRFRERVRAWAMACGVDLPTLVDGAGEVAALGSAGTRDPIRPGATQREIRGWENRYGFPLPPSLRAWMALSDGLLSAEGPLVHPLAAIGPMVPFAKMPEPIVQPESWFELGNPGRETVCIDLAYRWPGGDCPVFASGDDENRTSPRVIASGFAEWLARLIAEGGREYWLDSDFRPLGDPWSAHRRHVPMPPLPDRLKPFARRALPLMRTGADDRSVAAMLGVTRGDVEALFRHLQHAPA